MFARGFRETSEVAYGPGLSAVLLRDSYRRRVLQCYSIMPRCRGSEGRETVDTTIFSASGTRRTHVAELRGVAFSDIQKSSLLLVTQ